MTVCSIEVLTVESSVSLKAIWFLTRRAKHLVMTCTEKQTRGSQEHIIGFWLWLFPRMSGWNILSGFAFLFQCLLASLERTWPPHTCTPIKWHRQCQVSLPTLILDQLQFPSECFKKSNILMRQRGKQQVFHDSPHLRRQAGNQNFAQMCWCYMPDVTFSW